MPNVGPYIYDVSISGFTRSSICTYDFSSLRVNSQKVPYANTAKYIGMTLDAKLRWKAHVKKKREELGLRYLKKCIG